MSQRSLDILNTIYRGSGINFIRGKKIKKKLFDFYFLKRRDRNFLQLLFNFQMKILFFDWFRNENLPSSIDWFYGLVLPDSG